MQKRYIHSHPFKLMFTILKYKLMIYTCVVTFKSLREGR